MLSMSHVVPQRLLSLFAFVLSSLMAIAAVERPVSVNLTKTIAGKIER